VWTKLKHVIWECRCPDGKVLTSSNECRLFCDPNKRAASEQVFATISTLSVLTGKEKSELIEKTKWYCEDCPEGTKSDGEGPCIPCVGKNSYVANGACLTCKSWQKANLAQVRHGGSRCEDICPNGIYLPARHLDAGSGPEEVRTLTGPPGKKGKDPSASLAKQRGPLPAEATSPAGVPIPLGTSPTATPALVRQDCAPCGGNSYAANNKCHSCGNDAIADTFARTCRKCDKHQVAKLIKGAWMCAADCTGVRFARDATKYTNFIADPDDRTKCIPCPRGSKPNAEHTACAVSASVSVQPAPEVDTTEPSLPPTGRPVLPLAGGRPSKREKAKDVPRRKDILKGKTVRVVCPPGTHKNPRGDGCLPNARPPDFGKIIGVKPRGLPGQVPSQGRRVR
jgi:hypothetical protein